MYLNGRHNTPWIFPTPVDDSPAFRLFCFPYAGGGASVFRCWQPEMSPGAQILGVQLPGRENRLAEKACTEMGELVERLFAALQPLLDRPFALFGHSLGAKIAFELARFMRRRRIAPRCLFVAGSRAPHFPEPRPLHHLPEAEFIRELRRYAATPEALLENRELMAVYLPLLRADFTLDETYVLAEDEPLNCPIVAYGGADDPELLLPELDAWAQYSEAGFSRRLFPGGHFFIRSAQSEMLAQLRRDLVALQAGQA